MRGGQQNVGIGGVHDHVGAAGVVVDLDEAGRPGLAAVGGFIEAALTAALPERTGRRHVNHVGIARIDHDAGDVLGVLEAYIAPGAAGVFTFVNTVAIGDTPLVIVLAGAGPDDGGILRVDGDGADGVGAVIIEDRSPGGAVVVGQEDAAGCF